MEQIQFEYDSWGNIIKAELGGKFVSLDSVADYNKITEDDDMTVVRAKQEAQRQVFTKLLSE